MLLVHVKCHYCWCINENAFSWAQATTYKSTVLSTVKETFVRFEHISVCTMMAREMIGTRFQTIKDLSRRMKMNCPPSDFGVNYSTEDIPDPSSGIDDSPTDDYAEETPPHSDAAFSIDYDSPCQSEG